MKCLVIMAAVSVLLVAGDVQAQSRHINLTECHVWPSERLGENSPAAAIDRSTATCTWCTWMYNTSVASIAVAFEDTAEVTRIRLWKDDDGTGYPTPMPKDLTIFYTSDEGPLDQRTWTRVSGLVGNFGGTEVFHADSIGADGFVWGDVHDSVNEGDGWGSLVFVPAMATGVRIQFANSAGCPSPYVHYKVHEFEAYAAGSEAVRETSWGLIKSLYQQ
jgi:hypothetical protein